VSYRYVRSLSNALWAVGIRGRLARRITTEIADHLSEDPEADLGSPETLAAEFADELGTARARTAAAEVFAALTLVGGLLLGAFLASRAAGVRWPAVQPRYSFLALAGGGALVIGAQVAFVAGVLAAIRALRLRRERVIPRAEARVIVRRAAVALAGGLAATAGVALIGFDLQAGVPGWVTTVVVAAAGTGAIALLASAPAMLAAARVQPLASGGRGDLFDDLGPIVPAPLRGRPWMFAIVVAAAVALAVAVAGVVQSDPFDGIARGLADGLACLAGFAVLGGFLGLRG
jgi:MFS family permease